jgi:hypothetical protein
LARATCSGFEEGVGETVALGVLDLEALSRATGKYGAGPGGLEGMPGTTDDRVAVAEGSPLAGEDAVRTAEGAAWMGGDDPVRTGGDGAAWTAGDDPVWTVGEGAT